jgi:hypothetical protein
MEDQVYIVTLYRKDDLENFYEDMKARNITLVSKRPLSRNTHYILNEEQVEELKKDPRVWGVELLVDYDVQVQTINNESYTKSGTFWKDDTVAPATVSPTDYQWGHLHCAGNASQRGKNLFGPISSGWSYESVVETIEVYNNGKYVDIVIVDDPISYDSEEWYSPSTGTSRFVQYQWFNELNSFVSSIDDDLQPVPVGTITYDENINLSISHGNHVAGIAAGQHYGWAKEANIYNLAVTSPWSSGQQVGGLLIFDYLRAFHLNKPVNPITGVKNPTITNHSYGGIRFMPQKGVDAEGNPIYRLDLSDIDKIRYRGIDYSATNPGPSGWTESGIDKDFGVKLNVSTYPRYSLAINADILDAVEDGVIIIGAAGNDNLYIASPNDQDWNNLIYYTDATAFNYTRGAWPNSPDNESITVGSLSKEADFRRSFYSNYGPGIDIFAPGDNILSAYGNTGLPDSKYTQGSANYFYPESGTSMASPQLCGIAACIASTVKRFTQNDLIGFIQQNSIDNDMTFDLFGGDYDDVTAQKGSPNKYLHIENPREESGYLISKKGKRESGILSFPRVNILFKQ